MVRAHDQCFENYELEQQNLSVRLSARLSVSLPVCLMVYLSQTFVAPAKTPLTCAEDQAFYESLYLYREHSLLNKFMQLVATCVD